MYVCPNNHYVCETCWTQMGARERNCYTCKAEVQLASDKTLEELPKRMRFQCLNKGCSTVLKYDEVKHHTETCIDDPDRIIF